MTIEELLEILNDSDVESDRRELNSSIDNIEQNESVDGACAALQDAIDATESLLKTLKSLKKDFS